jgi:hypothetical protein
VYQPFVSPLDAFCRGEKMYMLRCMGSNAPYSTDELFEKVVTQLSEVEPYIDCVYQLSLTGTTLSSVELWLRFQRWHGFIVAKENREASKKKLAPPSPQAKPKGAGGGGAGPPPAGGTAQRGRPPAGGSAPSPCRYYLAGSCKSGDNCSFPHPQDAGGQPRDPSGKKKPACYTCGSIDHLTHQCPKKPEARKEVSVTLVEREDT